MAWPARWRSPQRGEHKSHPHTASPSLIIHYTRRNARTGDETIEKGVVAESLALKYRHIFKKRPKKAKRPTKKSCGQPTWNTAKFQKFGRKTANLPTLCGPGKLIAGNVPSNTAEKVLVFYRDISIGKCR